MLPVTVTVRLPSGACGLALIFSVELPGVVTGLALKVAVTLEGRPDTLSVTELLPPTAPRFTVNEPLDLRFTVNVVEESPMVKSLDCTVRLRLVVCVVVPSYPLMVRL